MFIYNYHFTGHNKGTSYKNEGGTITEFESIKDYGGGSNFYGHKWDNGLRISFSVLKEGLQWGSSQTGSIIYNSTNIKKKFQVGN